MDAELSSRLGGARRSLFEAAVVAGVMGGLPAQERWLYGLNAPMVQRHRSLAGLQGQGL